MSLPVADYKNVPEIVGLDCPALCIVGERLTDLDTVDCARQPYMRALGGYLLSAEAYTESEKTQCGNDIIGCVEPRPEDGIMKSIIQSPGGAVGEVIDIALSGAIDDLLVRSPNFAEIADAAVQHDLLHRNGTVLDAHRGEEAHEHAVGCAVTDFAEEIVDNMARSRKVLQLAFDIGRVTGNAIDVEIVDEVATNAAELHNSLTLPHDKLQVVDAVDRKYPRHSNIRYISGEKRAVAYVLNLTGLALDRNKFHSQPFASKAQVYHDSLSLALSHIDDSYVFEEDVRQRRATARLMRSLSTWEVVAGQGYVPLLALMTDLDSLKLTQIG